MAQFGVIFLLFALGLEFSMTKVGLCLTHTLPFLFLFCSFEVLITVFKIMSETSSLYDSSFELFEQLLS